MRAPATLRRRVALAFAALGLVMSGLLVGAVLIVTDDYESLLAAEILRGQADDYALQLANGLPAALPQTQRLSGYRGRVPAWLASLPPGMHEDLQYEGQHVGVFDTTAGRLYFVIDLGDIERLEQHLDAWLAAFVALGVATSAALGWWLAGGALRPLRRLAASVEQLQVRPARTSLAEGMPDDELRQLAGAIDDYQARLATADEREQAFFADASHELRTPIAVVRGVTDVLLDDAPVTARGAQRLERLDRGVRELSDLVEALLAVARRRPLQMTELDLAALARDAITETSTSDGMTLATGAPVPIRAAAELPVLLRMILRRLTGIRGRIVALPGQLAIALEDADHDPAAVLSPLAFRLAQRIEATLSTDAAGIVLRLAPPST